MDIYLHVHRCVTEKPNSVHITILQSVRRLSSHHGDGVSPLKCVPVISWHALGNTENPLDVSKMASWEATLQKILVIDLTQLPKLDFHPRRNLYGRF